MAKSNKFGFAPLETEPPQRRERSVGPMGAAVREAAESLTDATEAKVEKRRQNAVDAEAFRTAQDEGRVLMSLELSQIATDDLPRDRMDLEAVAASDEMEELKASIRERGQKEPIEVYPGPDGSFQLKKAGAGSPRSRSFWRKPATRGSAPSSRGSNGAMTGGWRGTSTWSRKTLCAKI